MRLIESPDINQTSRDGSVFISYSREDIGQANEVRRAFEVSGLRVFWDENIRPSAHWSRWLQERLQRSSAVVVLWSEKSVKSRWVGKEARAALTQGKLIPAFLSKVHPPRKFAAVQGATLFGHEDFRRCPGWNGLVCAVWAFVLNSSVPERQDELEDLYYRFLHCLNGDGIDPGAVRKALHRMSLELLENAEPGSLIWHRLDRFRGRA